MAEKTEQVFSLFEWHSPIQLNGTFRVKLETVSGQTLFAGELTPLHGQRIQIRIATPDRPEHSINVGAEWVEA